MSEDPEVQWFGTRWNAGICEDDDNKVEVPVGEACGYCGVPIEIDDSGLLVPVSSLDPWEAERRPYHLSCFLQMIARD